MSTLANISAVLFDLDGLCIDSESIYTIVTDEILLPYNKTLTWEIKAGIMGRPGPDAARYLINATGIPLTPEELLSQMEVKLPVAFSNVKVLPGAEKLILHLKKHNIPIAIATGSKRSNFNIKISKLSHIFNNFENKVICGDDTILKGKGKPDPTIFLEAAKLLNFVSLEERKKVLVFEDARLGVEAARAAGMEVVWVPDVELVKVMGESHDLNPTQTLTSLELFKPEQFGLPPY